MNEPAPTNNLQSTSDYSLRVRTVKYVTGGKLPKKTKPVQAVAELSVAMQKKTYGMPAKEWRISSLWLRTHLCLPNKPVMHLGPVR